MQYTANITAGAWKLPKSSVLADSLLPRVDAEFRMDVVVWRMEGAKAISERQTSLLGRQENTGA